MEYSELVNELIKDLLPEEKKKKIVAAYGGGFKPPTKGHFEVVTTALNNFPEIDEFIIYVGGGERGDINQAQSILIWEIYQTYLPMKVKIEPSKAPIGDIVRLGKNNLQDEIYFIVGAREGFEGDVKDIESRTKNIEEKYPNMKVKVITTIDKGISGTNARKASQVSYDDFTKYIPSELSDNEKEEVYNIVKPSISETNNPEDGKAAPYGSGYNKLNEDITKSQLDALETYADKLFAKLGIDVEFTRHFLDRANDERNIKPISIPELMGMFKRLHKKHGKPLSKVDNDFDAVVKDFNSNINIPFAINVTPNDIDLVAKTVMRKKDFKTSTPVIALNENATYTKKINLINRLATLTQHMLDKGMNIEPLPKLEFMDGDVENASEFLGKTAYYDPNTQTIVLYTEGRHPKDITRSYAHEMIHHIQNLEGRLGNITTTNTQEDDNLNDIEAEANLKGTMTFRNWTDSLNENTSLSFPNSALLFGGFFTGIQRMGIGKTIISDLFKSNPKLDNLLLYTQDDAIGFWKKLGGKIIQQGEDKKGVLRYFVQINKNDVDTNLNLKQLGISYKNLSTKKSKIDKGEYAIKMGRQKIGFFFVRDIGTIQMDPMSIFANNLNEDNIFEIGEASSKSFEWKEGSASNGQTVVYDYEVYFTTDLGTKYEVNIDVYDVDFDKGKTYKMLDIAFGVESQSANQITNKGELFSVMATIVNIAKHYLKKLKVNGIIYNPSKKSKEGYTDNQRNKLYKTYIQKAFPNAKIKEDKKGIIVLLDNKPLNEIQSPAKEKDVDSKELKTGIEVEMEHTNSPSEAKVIALQHLAEDPKYYTKLKSLNLEEKDYFGLNAYTRELVQGLEEAIVGDKIECDNCDWSWDIKDGGDDLYTCHKCWHDNTPQLNEGRYDKSSNQFSKIAFEAFKDIHDRGDKEGTFVKQKSISQKDKENILDIWRSRRVSLSLPIFENKTQDMDYEIYSDMDGVLTDFDAHFMEASDGMLPSEYQKIHGVNGFWSLIDEGGEAYWVEMPWMPDGKTYWDYIKGYNPILLSSPSRSSSSRIGKRVWVKNNLPGTKLILSQSKDKQNYAQKNRILIDDRPSNIEQWRSQGGIGILHTSAADTIQQLKKLGL